MPIELNKSAIAARRVGSKIQASILRQTGEFMYDKNTLKDKIAFIAGGTSGINLGIAKGLVEVGAKVAVLGRNPDKAKAAVQEV